MIAAQLDIGSKIAKADHVIWNDSTVPNLDGQTRLLVAWLKRWDPEEQTAMEAATNESAGAGGNAEQPANPAMSDQTEERANAPENDEQSAVK